VSGPPPGNNHESVTVNLVLTSVIDRIPDVLKSDFEMLTEQDI